MKRKTGSCCGTGGEEADVKQMEIPEQIQRELDEAGGFGALAGRVPDPNGIEESSRVFHALADPLRLTILYLIRNQPLCVCVINRFMRLSGSKLSYHLNILKESGLIRGENDGNWIIYSITDSGQKALEYADRMNPANPEQ